MIASAMILIKEKTEEKLAPLLEVARAQNDPRRCLYLKISLLDNVDLAKVEEAVHLLIDDTDCMVAVCENSDIFILSYGLNTKTVKPLERSLLGLLPTSPASLEETPAGLATLFDLRVNWFDLMDVVDKKLKDKRQREKDIREKRERAKQEKKRQAALDAPVDMSLVRTLSERRKDRDLPEILVVEDDLFSQRLVKTSLKGKFKPVLVEDGRSAIIEYVAKAPDILFLDIGLPDISGHDILKEILEIDPDAFVVMLSGKGDQENILRALESGAKGFVGKPFTKDKLLQYIRKSPYIQDKKSVEGA